MIWRAPSIPGIIIIAPLVWQACPSGAKKGRNGRSMDKSDRILNLMQFARKAGKLTGGADACLRELHRRHLHLVVIAKDAAARTFSRMENELIASGQKIQILSFSERETISAALGMPLTAVFGISDKNFAKKMIEYWQA